jgi:hypothetical protein
VLKALRGPLAPVVALALALSMAFYIAGVLIPQQRASAAQTSAPRGNLSDLYPRWYGAREALLHGRDPYSADVTREIQVGYYGRAIDPSRPNDPRDQQGFAYPFYVAFLLAPTFGLPFATLAAGFGYLLLALTALSVPLWLYAVGWRPPLAVTLALTLLTLGSFPTLQGVALQQLSLVVGALLAGAAAALVGGRHALAGALLALATIKPQIAAPLVAWLALWTISDWPRRQGVAWGFSGVMALLVGGAQIAAPGWIGRFLTALGAYQQYTAGQPLFETLLTPWGGRLAAAAGILLVAGVCWRARRAPAGSAGFALALALVPALTLAIIPTWAPYNQVLLLPGLLLALREAVVFRAQGRPGKYVYFLLWLLVLWPWVASVTLTLASLALPATTVQQGWPLPLFSSLFIPLITLAALGLLARVWLRERRLEAPA